MIYVKDLERMKQFYGDMLGAKPTNQDWTGVWARLESLGITVIRSPWQWPGEACDAVDPEGNIFQICAPGVDALL